MRTMKRMLCLLICVVTCASLAVPAMAAIPETYDEARKKMAMESTLSDYDNFVKESYNLFEETYDWDTKEVSVVKTEGDWSGYTIIPQNGSVTVKALDDTQDHYIRVVMNIYEKVKTGEYVKRWEQFYGQDFILRNGGFYIGAIAGWADDSDINNNDKDDDVLYKYIMPGEKLVIDASELIKLITFSNSYTPKSIENYLFSIELQQVYPEIGRYWYTTYSYVIDDNRAEEIKSKGKVDDDPDNPFTDVPKDSYYHDAVVWALKNDVTTGMSATTFGPNETCTRGQVVTFLWRAMGRPEPETTENPFKDIQESDYYYKPILWAYENGITTGVSETEFGPSGTCTSAHVVTFLWRANGKPAAVAEGTEYYAEAVAWANGNGLLEGVGNAFKPENNSPRSDIVTYLYRNAK